ncbi:MAG: SDR family NAD(P)-dependent oxidoreductase [Deltaproteobacteria bacterium]|nr:MAG: SDR family NAD(P)-dependent oxidoreductase [Deltaproteobacteria bacterium]
MLHGKVALVTGSSRGIGRAIAERLGRDSASVIANYTDSADKAQEVVAAVESAQETVTYLIRINA